MGELSKDIRDEIHSFLDSERVDIFRSMRRSVVTPSRGVDIEITQDKKPTKAEIDMFTLDGNLTVPPEAWFNDVEMISEPKDELTSNRLRLEATYPLEYFDEEPQGGTFRGNAWLESYGTFHGFGSQLDNYSWRIDFVEQNAGSLTRLWHPNDPSAIGRYNARFREYLQTLGSSDVTVTYDRAWDKAFSLNARSPRQYLGGLTLLGFGTDQVIKQGESATREINQTSVLLRNEIERDGYIGQLLTITDNDAVAEHFGGDEEVVRPAEVEVLSTALELVRNAINGS